MARPKRKLKKTTTIHDPRGINRMYFAKPARSIFDVTGSLRPNNEPEMSKEDRLRRRYALWLARIRRRHPNFDPSVL